MATEQPWEYLGWQALRETFNKFENDIIEKDRLFFSRWLVVNRLRQHLENQRVSSPKEI